jgi:HEAT repeat protein/beta-lactamase regulating signal transducer with metallopeptidase domain
MFADAMPVLIESCLRASLVLGAAWILTAAMRRASAATRHFVWSCAVAGAIAASAISAFGPRWNVPVPAAFAASTQATPAMQPDLAPEPEGTNNAIAAIENAENPRSQQSAPAGGGINTALLLALLWAAGSLGVLAYALCGAAGAWWIRRSATPIEAPWVDEALVLAEAFEVTGPIGIVESRLVSMPLVCGLWHPLIVMPVSAKDWSDERRRVVALHELAHIKRRDCLIQAIANVVCAVYWFNPIVWVAARQLRIERERACDDFVLAAGERGSDYATHLLEMARTSGPRRVPAFVGLAMARPSQLEGRLLAILDPAVRRSSALRTRLGLVAIVLSLTLPVGAIELVESAPTATLFESAGPLSATSIGSSTLTLEPTPAPAPRPTPAPRPAPAATPAASARMQALSQAAGDLELSQINENAQALSERIGRDVAMSLSAQTGAAADPKTIEALIGALADPDPDVRETVVTTLGRMRDDRVVPALLPLLKDSNAEVREQVVFALARTRDPRAIAAVAAMIDDASPDVREQAVHLLGQSRRPDAVPTLIRALTDSSADVREQAAFGLGQLRDASGVDPLIELLKDTSPDVREQAVFALGQLRSGRAVDGLMAALKDSSADVREQAAFALGQLGDPKALPSLTAALRDSVPDVREQAAHAIGRISPRN